jgi:hypothetical protein
LIVIPAKYDFKPYAYGFQKDYPYLDLFNYFLSELKESGAYDKILKNYEPLKQVCPDYSGLPLGFDSCISLFLVILAGLAACFCLFFMECILNYLYPQLNWFSSIPPEESCKNCKKLQEKLQVFEQQIRHEIF